MLLFISFNLGQLNRKYTAPREVSVWSQGLFDISRLYFQTTTQIILLCQTGECQTHQKLIRSRRDWMKLCCALENRVCLDYPLCGMLSETISCRTRASTYASLDVCRRGLWYTYKEQGVIILTAENIHTHPPDSRSSHSSSNWVVHKSKTLCRQLCSNK